MSNKEFIRDFIRGERRFGAYCHLGYADDKLFNYSTEICRIDRAGKRAEVNTRKYSSTTTRIQSTLAFELKSMGYTITEYIGEPASPWNSGYMGARNVTKGDMYWRGTK